MATLRNPNTLFLLLTLCIVGLRLALMLGHEGQVGVDGGAYLLSRNNVLGDEPTGAGFPRPPLAPGWLLVPFTSALGDETGYKVWSVLASVLPLLPVFLLASSLIGPRLGLLAAFFFGIDLLQAEMLVTGALPLIGFFLLGMALVAINHLAAKPTKEWALCLIVTVGAIPWVNQTSAGMAVILLPLYWVALLMFTGRGERYPSLHRSAVVWGILPPAVIGAFIGLAALPWYLTVLPGTGVLDYPGPWLLLTHPFDIVWVQTLLALSVGVPCALRMPSPAGKALAVLLIATGLLAPFRSYDETLMNVFYRSQYLMPLFFFPCVFWMVAHWGLPRLSAPVASINLFLSNPAIWGGTRDFPLAGALTTVAAGVMLWGFLWSFNGQARYSIHITPETEAALSLASDDGTTGVVTNGFTLGLWIAALNKVPAPHIWTAKPPAKWIEDDAMVRCLLGWVPGCDYGEARDALGVSHVLIEHRFPWINDRVSGNYLAPTDQWQLTAEAPWLTLLYNQGTTKLWAIK